MTPAERSTRLDALVDEALHLRDRAASAAPRDRQRLYDQAVRLDTEYRAMLSGTRNDDITEQLATLARSLQDQS